MAKEGDLSVTALYTSQTWTWGGLSCAHLFANADAKRVFDVTNAALAVSRVFRKDFAPLQHALLHRHTMIDHLLRESHARQVIELAAGLSRRGAAFSQEESLSPALLDYTEIDLPHLVARKKALLERTDEGRAVLARPALRLVGADVATAPLEPYVLPGEPLFVIAEGLMMYLAPDAQRGLWARVRKVGELTQHVRLVFDLVPVCEQPKPGAVGRTLEAAMKVFTGGRSFERDARTRADIAEELRDAGFAHGRLIEPSEVAAAWGLPFPEMRTQQLLFVATR